MKCRIELTMRCADAGTDAGAGGVMMILLIPYQSKSGHHGILDNLNYEHI